MKENKLKILKDPDFINIKRYDYSIKRLKERYPEGAPDKVVASALMLTEEELEEFHQYVVEKLRGLMGVE